MEAEYKLIYDTRRHFTKALEMLSRISDGVAVTTYSR